MSEPFRTTRLVEFHDTDMAGIMHFASFFHYMESAEHELIRSIGYSVHGRINGELLSFPRVAASCDFHSPARSEDVLDIEIWLTRIGNKSLHYRLEFSIDGRESRDRQDYQRPVAASNRASPWSRCRYRTR